MKLNEMSKVNRSKKKAEDHYNKISKYYDYLEGLFEKKHRNYALKKLKIEKGKNVLEIGPGTGHALKKINESVGSKGSVYGLDISRNMLCISKRRLRDNNLLQNSVLIQGDGSRLPLKNSIFDYCFMSFSLELFDTPDIDNVLSEIRRVLNEEGKICVVSLSKKNKLPVKLYELLHKFFPRGLDCRPIPVKKLLEKNFFNITYSENKNMMGLPIEIVIGKK